MGDVNQLVCVPVHLLLCEHLATHRLMLVFKDVYFFFTSRAHKHRPAMHLDLNSRNNSLSQ